MLGPVAGHPLADRFGLESAFDTAWNIGRWAPFRVFTPGAIVGVLVWLGTSALFGIYTDHFASYETTYGTLGGGARRHSRARAQRAGGSRVVGACVPPGC